MNQDLWAMIFWKTNYGKSSKTWFDSQEIMYYLYSIFWVIFLKMLWQMKQNLLWFYNHNPNKYHQNTYDSKNMVQTSYYIIFFRGCYAIFCLLYLRQNMKFLLWCYFFGLLCLDRKSKKDWRARRKKGGKMGKVWTWSYCPSILLVA